MNGTIRPLVVNDTVVPATTISDTARTNKVIMLLQVRQLNGGLLKLTSRP